MGQSRSVCILDKVREKKRALAVGAKTTNFSRKREEHGRPVATGIGFGKRASDRTAIAHLHVGNARGAVMQDRNFCNRDRCLDLRMPGQSTETEHAIVFFDVRSTCSK